jgi:hypothetical protein
MASTLSFIDRQILNVMIGPIKRDPGGLSDTEISLIIGLMNDYVFKSESAIGLSLASLSVVNYSIAAVCLYFGLGPLRRAIELMKAS